MLFHIHIYIVYIVHSCSEAVFIISINIHDLKFSLFKELLERLLNYKMDVSTFNVILYITRIMCIPPILNLPIIYYRVNRRKTSGAFHKLIKY